MAEWCFPVDEQDFTDEQWAQTQVGSGHGVIDDWGDPYNLSLNSGANTATVGLSSVSGAAKAVLHGFGHQIDQPVTLALSPNASTDNRISLIYTPAADANTPAVVALTVEVGTPTLSSGQYRLPLWSVSVPASGGLSAATITDLRERLARNVAVNTDRPQASPTSHTRGTRAYSLKSGIEFYATYLPGTTTPAWVSNGRGIVGYTNLAASVNAGKTAAPILGLNVDVVQGETYLVSASVRAEQINSTGYALARLTVDGGVVATFMGNSDDNANPVNHDSQGAITFPYLAVDYNTHTFGIQAQSGPGSTAAVSFAAGDAHITVQHVGNLVAP